jgi:2-polyprenyl-3-methyl-5-hydroxy-6-metoxy-1,4-benzoquinol methylase
MTSRARWRGVIAQRFLRYASKIAASNRCLMDEESVMSNEGSLVDHYDAQYGNFASELYAQVRSVVFGEDIGQNGWLTANEQDLFLSYLSLEKGSKLLDVACGSGGPTLRIARLTGCSVHGVDAHGQAIAEARARSQQEGLAGRASFDQLDASQLRHLPDASFDSLTCIDAVNHLPDRVTVFSDWARLLRGTHGRAMACSSRSAIYGTPRD